MKDGASFSAQLQHDSIPRIIFFQCLPVSVWLFLQSLMDPASSETLDLLIVAAFCPRTCNTKAPINHNQYVCVAQIWDSSDTGKIPANSAFYQIVFEKLFTYEKTKTCVGRWFGYNWRGFSSICTSCLCIKAEFCPKSHIMRFPYIIRSKKYLKSARMCGCKESMSDRPCCGSTQFGRVRRRRCNHKTFVVNYVLSNKITEVSHFRCLRIICGIYFSLQRIFTVFRDGSSKIFSFILLSETVFERSKFRCEHLL